MLSHTSSIDTRLALGYGSAWHLLRMLGWHRQWFSEEVATAVGASNLEWVDFPYARPASVYPSGTPIRDSEWERLDFIPDATVQKRFDEFWPKTGSSQNWDAIGRATISGESTWILVEAKAHLGEVSHSGTTAKESGGRPMIRRAFRETLMGLGHAEVEADRLSEVWLKGYYQHANRLATLHFLGHAGVSAKLVYVYFCGDRHPSPKQCPDSPALWKPFLDALHLELGLSGKSLLEKRVHEIFINVDKV